MTTVSRIYVDGVFDMFHVGHLNLFRQARELGDYLIVGIHDDEQVMTYKERPIVSFDQRVEMVRHCRLVDEVIERAPLATDRAYLTRLGRAVDRPE